MADLHTSNVAAETGAGMHRLAYGYRPLAGARDECMDGDANVRAPYAALFNSWDGLDDTQLQSRRQTADRYLKDNGVAHRVYGDERNEERPWPLSDVPLVLDAGEWADLERGLIQRAHLLEAVIADCYGAQNLVRDGHIPASIVASALGFLRPLVGHTPKSGHHLHFIAVELGRGPDGRWWVLGDRTQAPSGVGYALENRLAMNRAMGENLRALNVTRLASFFDTFRSSIGRWRGASASRVGLLTPGPFNETYYEQALLARYLGLLLLEGGDLIARDGKLFIRTVRGLKQIDVLWRRVDADFCDPLELNPGSQLGVPGLVDVLRQGGVTCVNSLGAGLVESRGFLAFLPQICQHLLGEPQALPTIATWWQGSPAMVAEAEAAIGDTVQLSASGTSLPSDRPYHKRPQGQADLPLNTVTQESVRLSTMPVLENTGSGFTLQPHPFSLRVFLARTGDDWVVMPGGFCRVSDGSDTRALSMHDGSRSCDVWVQSTSPIQTTPSLITTGKQAIRRVPGTLPARAADNLFWLGRYAERIQLTLRLTRAYLVRRSEIAMRDDPLLVALRKQLAQWGVEDPTSATVFQSALLPGLMQAHQAASAIRDRLSPDAWQALHGFVSGTQNHAFTKLNTPEKINAALTMLATFSGLASENMIRLTGWRFLEIGRRLERALGTCQVTRLLGLPPADNDAYAETANLSVDAGAGDVLLELADSTMSYRQRYAVSLETHTLLDLVLLDPNNPRAVAFQLEKIHLHLGEISDHPAFEQPTDLQRAAFALWSTLNCLTAENITLRTLTDVENQMVSLSATIGHVFITPGDHVTKPTL